MIMNETPVLFEGDVPTYALDTVRERTDKLNRRAERRGFPRVTLTIERTFDKPDPSYDGDAEHAPLIEYATIAIHADASLRMDGWTLVGVVAADAVDADGNRVPMITNVPGQTFDGTVTDAMLCEHCNARRMRSETFLLRHDDGRDIQVGRQCIRDFLGHDPAAILAGVDAYESLIPSESERSGWDIAAPRVWPLRDIIHAAARIVAAEGWYVSKAKAIDSENSDRPVYSTASRVYPVLEPASRKEFERLAKEYPSDEKADALTDATIDALNSLNPSNEWEYKLVEYAKLARVGARHFGILASATILGLRAQEREQKAIAEKAAREASGAVDAYIGQVGQRVTVAGATVSFVREFEGSYGVTTLLKFDTPEGAVQWWQTGGKRGWEAGQTVTLTGTVKGHEADRFTNRPTTTLTRCKVS
jgi:hypothetical protein